MDKIFSTRIDESIIYLLNSLSRELHTSKKKVIEKAIESYSESIHDESRRDVFEETFGVWKRDEDPAETKEMIKKHFTGSMRRYHP